MQNKKKFLTIHGHFYQPPRENPWLETIELQDSASPFHNWNERIAHECYTPNSVSRIVDDKNRILDIVNNYTRMSFNFGPTLLSWLEVSAPKTYERILEADKISVEEYSGHGNALAQVYNHIIMPLANEKDKYTQIIWGIKDFQYRFGRNPEGIWLAETAADEESLKALVDCGIKYTVLSPYQASKVKPIGSNNNDWSDVSWGNVDPGQAYRYFLKDGSNRFIDLFFYDGSISRAVAFENLLQNGDKFINRINDGVSDTRNYDQLVNLATDGESYGHHTRFGDMALSYILKIRSEQVGLKISNYGEFLDIYPPTQQAEIKEPSSWSCCHGVERWKADCGCSTGAGAGWNQKWRKPLREALDWLRDQLIVVYEENASKYLNDPWASRNRYIDVILDRNKPTIRNFCHHEAKRKLNNDEIVDVIKLLEMQRQAMLMYTSCGWFFADISGIETVQILKYAAKAMQIAEEFTDKSFEADFMEKLSEARSNISKYGSGKDLYIRFVKPSVISIKQVVSHWAISSLFEEYNEDTEVYCYNVKSLDYRKVKKGNTTLLIGRLEIYSKVTFERQDMIFTLLHFSGEDFHCVIKGFTGNSEYHSIKDDLIAKYNSSSLTEVIRSLDEHFGKDYCTIKDLFIDERRKIINILTKDQLEKFSSTYKNLYEEGKGPMEQLNELGLSVPPEYKIAAEYSLSYSLNNLITNADDIGDEDLIEEVLIINKEAKKLGVNLDRKPSEKVYSKFITEKVRNLAEIMEIQECENLINVLCTATKLKFNPDLSEAQNYYFNAIYVKVPELIEIMKRNEDMSADKNFIATLLNLGERLNFNVEKLYNDLNKASSVQIQVKH